jgi:hypothetical protein
MRSPDSQNPPRASRARHPWLSRALLALLSSEVPAELRAAILRSRFAAALFP